MNRKECLDAAAEAVLKNRQATYGPPENSFADTAVVWSVILGVEVKPWQVPLMLAGLKVVRAKASPDHADNWVDLAGYAACGAELATAPSPQALAEYLAKTPPEQWGDIPDDPMPCQYCGGTDHLSQACPSTKGLDNEAR